MSAIGTTMATENGLRCRHRADIARMATTNRMDPRLRMTEIGIMTSTTVDRDMTTQGRVILANTRIPGLIRPRGLGHTQPAVALVLMLPEKVKIQLGLL